MPELPEVEVIRRGLTPHVLGREIGAIRASGKELRLPVPVRSLQRWVKGSTITGLDRRGKYLRFSLDSGAAMIVHLGMTGRLGIFPCRAPQTLHDHLFFSLHPGRKEMRYNDVRRFGCVRVLDPEENLAADPFHLLGPEPLGEHFSGAYLREQAGHRLQPVKNFLLDGRVVAGIGNIYANEILFACAIDPATPIGSISLAKWEELAHCTRQVLERAIASGGTTISDFVGASGRKGYFQLELMVYGRAGERCFTCGTTVEKTMIGGRSTFFCPVCQR